MIQGKRDHHAKGGGLVADESNLLASNELQHLHLQKRDHWFLALLLFRVERAILDVEPVALNIMLDNNVKCRTFYSPYICILSERRNRTLVSATSKLCRNWICGTRPSSNSCCSWHM